MSNLWNSLTGSTIGSLMIPLQEKIYHCDTFNEVKDEAVKRRFIHAGGCMVTCVNSADAIQAWINTKDFSMRFSDKPVEDEKEIDKSTTMLLTFLTTEQLAIVCSAAVPQVKQNYDTMLDKQSEDGVFHVTEQSLQAHPFPLMVFCHSDHQLMFFKCHEEEGAN